MRYERSSNGPAADATPRSIPQLRRSQQTSFSREHAPIAQASTHESSHVRPRPPTNWVGNPIRPSHSTQG
eukprot:12617666-Alexandrium_andersonii.AAC.1